MTMEQGQSIHDQIRAHANNPNLQAEQAAAQAAQAPTAEYAVAPRTPRRKFGRVIGGVAAAAVLVGTGMFIGDRTDNASSADETELVVDSNPANIETCPKGAFPDGHFESTEKALTASQELYQRPFGPIKNTSEMVSYMFGDTPGVVCRSASAMGGINSVAADILGMGGPSRGFTTSDANKLTDTYNADPAKGLRDSEQSKKIFEKAEQTKTDIAQPMFRLAAVATENPEHPFENVLIEEMVTLPAGEGYMLGYEQYRGNDQITPPEGANLDQKLLIVANETEDLNTGQAYVAKAYGGLRVVPMEQPSEENQDQADQGQVDQGDGSGVDKKKGGACPFCGGAGCDKCGNTGKCGDCGPGTPEGPKPPVTEVVPPYVPPTTPETTPPTTTPPTTAPPVTTTTLPKGSDPGTPGAPN